MLLLFVVPICFIGAFIQSSSMDDQKLKSIVEELVQGMKESTLTDMRSLLIEVVGSKTQRPERNAYDDRYTVALHFHHKPASVKFGRFCGKNPEAWIFQAERYFDFYRITEDQHLSLASFYLDGDALEWYRWLFRNNNWWIGSTLRRRCGFISIKKD